MNVKHAHSFVDLTGRKYGRLTVIRFNDRDKHNNINYLCRCVCGNEKVVTGSHLRSGDVKSCGCWLREFKAIHGMSRSATYNSWESMMGRCFNENDDRYSSYGGRGITVCDRWRKFENFLYDMGERDKWLSLDRIDNDGNYTPENCRWATASEQQRNRRANRLIEYRGETRCVAEWAEYLGINQSTLRKRLDRGKPVDVAFETEAKRGH